MNSDQGVSLNRDRYETEKENLEKLQVSLLPNVLSSLSLFIS